MSTSTLRQIQDAGQDFEWYPTTDRMIAEVAKRIPRDAHSIMDIGAGDGRVLLALAKRCERTPELYAIEKSPILMQQQPESITPVGTEFSEQNLACLPVDYIFCNPPYSQFEAWAATIIESGYALKAFMVIPRRWKDSKQIADSLKRRGATARVIHSDDFLDAERAARAVVDIVEVSYPRKDRHWANDEATDPFDIWFDQNITTFEPEEKLVEDKAGDELARIRHLNGIAEMVAGYDEDYARMEANYRAIFKLDYAILKELGVNKEGVRDGIKKRMAGLKTLYWQLLFERLDTITSRLATETKRHFLERLSGRPGRDRNGDSQREGGMCSIAFTANNAYAVALWAIKNANKYYDQQLVKLFRGLATFDGVLKYKSNQKVWNKDGWRWHNHQEEYADYALDYRFVVNCFYAIGAEDYKHPGGLNQRAHELLDDVIAVMGNLGFAARIVAPSKDQPQPEPSLLPSRHRQWSSGKVHEFHTADGKVLFEVRAFQNGNLHFRFMPEAIKALNIEAGRLLGWIRSKGDVVNELGYTPEDAQRYFGCHQQLGASAVKMLTMEAA